jgi:hypothetical protein
MKHHNRASDVTSSPPRTMSASWPSEPTADSASIARPPASQQTRECRGPDLTAPPRCKQSSESTPARCSRWTTSSCTAGRNRRSRERCFCGHPAARPPPKDDAGGPTSLHLSHRIAYEERLLHHILLGVRDTRLSRKGARRARWSLRLECDESSSRGAVKLQRGGEALGNGGRERFDRAGPALGVIGVELGNRQAGQAR